MTHCVLAIDQGTTGTTALLLDKNVSVIAQANVEFPNHILSRDTSSTTLRRSGPA